MHFKLNRSNLIKTIVRYVLVFSILELAFFVFMNFRQVKILDNYLRDYTKNIAKEIKFSRNSLSKFTNLFFDTQIHTKEVLDIMEEASQTKDTQTLASLRKKLYNLLIDKYNLFKKDDIGQIHFHLPKSISFLRFHKPESFGDNLINYRESINFINKNKINISIFEIGKYFNGFKNVFRLYKNEKFIGSVELSNPFSYIKNEFIKVSHTSLDFILKEDIVLSKANKYSLHNYQESPFKGYMYDSTVKHDDSMQLSQKDIRKLNKKISSEVKNQLKLGTAFSIISKINHHIENIEHSYTITFIPINDIKGEVNAYIIHYAFSNFSETLKSNFIMIVSLFTLANLLLSSYLFSLSYKQQIRFLKSEKISKIDALTSIYNRLGINKKLEKEFERNKRYNIECSLIFFDIDHFKQINDTYGHQIGDHILTNLAKLFSTFLRKTDIFGRWGGEEFIIILPNTNIKKATIVAKKLLKQIEKNNFYEIDTLTCSFGVTSISQQDNYDSAIKRVDSLMYKAKTEGRNRVISSL